MQTGTPGEFVDVPSDAVASTPGVSKVSVTALPGLFLQPGDSDEDVLVLSPCYPVHAESGQFTFMVCSGLVMRLKLDSEAVGPHTAFVTFDT